MNFAVPGYNTALEVATYAALARQFQPDIVILHIISNDFSIPLFLEKQLNIFSVRQSLIVEKLQHTLELSRRGLLGEQGFREAMKKLHALTKKDGAQVLILRSGLSSSMRQVVNEVSREYGFQIVSNRQAFSTNSDMLTTPISRARNAEELLLSPTDKHPNEFGHALLSEALFNSIQTKVRK